MTNKIYLVISEGEDTIESIGSKKHVQEYLEMQADNCGGMTRCKVLAAAPCRINTRHSCTSSFQTDPDDNTSLDYKTLRFTVEIREEVDA